MYRQRFTRAEDLQSGESPNVRHSNTQRSSSFSDRLRSSIFGILVGVILILSAIYLLAWNEYRSVRTTRSLDEALESVREVGQSYDPDLDGKLIHVTDKLHCDQVLADPLHGIAVGAIKLKRHVEMFQWVETEIREERASSNGETEVIRSYNYDTQWRSDLIRSNLFENSVLHKNPDSLPFQAETYTQSSATVGIYAISKTLIEQITSYVDLIPSTLPDERGETKLHQKYIYYSSNPFEPRVGDVRVSFSYAGLCRESKHGPAATVSLLGQQSGKMLSGYQTNSGDTIEMISLTSKSAKEMIDSAQAGNIMLKWVLRALGFVLNLFGFISLFSIIETLVSWIPFVRDIVHAGMLTFNVTMAMFTSLLVIACSWIVCRPLYASGIILLATCIIVSPGFRPGRSNGFAGRNW